MCLLGDPTGATGGQRLDLCVPAFNAQVCVHESDTFELQAAGETETEVVSAETLYEFATSPEAHEYDGFPGALARVVTGLLDAFPGFAERIAGPEGRMSAECRCAFPAPGAFGSEGAQALALTRALAARYGLSVNDHLAFEIARPPADQGTASPAQAYGGLLLVGQGGESAITRLNPAFTPPVALAWDAQASFRPSAGMRRAAARWRSGDVVVAKELARFDALCERATSGLLSGNGGDLAEALTEHRALEDQLFGTTAAQRRLMDLVSAFDGAAYRPAGGGAILIALSNDVDANAIDEAFRRAKAGFALLEREPGPSPAKRAA